MDGFELAQKLRDKGFETPILMLTARDAFKDIVTGLDAAPDDYLTKPFSFAELLARVRALSRRAPVPRGTTLSVSDLTLDPASHRCFRH